MYKKFASITHPQKYGYAFDSEGFRTGDNGIHSHFRMFETYGDGLTQHSGDWSVTSEYLADYLASAAQAMLTDDELAQNMRYSIWNRPNTKAIEFAATIVYKQPKEEERYTRKGRKYFDPKAMKISSAPAKEHDKRYIEITDVYDGTARSIFRVLIPDYADGLTRYAYADAIRTWTIDNDGPWMELPAEFLNWFKPSETRDCRDKSLELRSAYEACLNVTQAYQLKNAAQCGVENFIRSMERARDAAAKIDLQQAEPAPVPAEEQTVFSPTVLTGIAPTE